MSVISFFLKQAKTTNLIVLMILAGGYFTFVNSKKESFPNIQVLVVTISTIYPGGSPTEVEKLITKEIEEAIINVEGKKNLYSISKESKSLISFEIDPKSNIDPKTIRQELQNAINIISSKLPEGASKPLVENISYDKLPVLSVFFSGSDEDQLRHYIDLFEEKAKKLEGVDQVKKDGYRKKELWILGNPKKLKQNQLNLSDLVKAVQERNINLPAGKLTIKKEDYFIRTISEYQNLEQIKNTIIRSNDNGKEISIKDVADVKWGYEEILSYHRRDQKNGIFAHIIKKTSGDIISIADDTYKLIEEFKQILPPEIKISSVKDISFVVKRRLNVLSGNATFGLLLVFLCLILFFDLRTTFWTTMGIPISFCAALIITNFMGISINMISMFGFIIVIGMIVDDAIVVGENIYRLQEKGMSPIKAVIEGTSQVLGSIAVAVGTTCVAFLPLLTLPDIWGDFLGTLAIVTVVTMITSFFECIFILPSHLAYNKKNKQVREKKWFVLLQKKYAHFLTIVLKKPLRNFSILALLCFTSVIVLFKTNLVPFVLFPDIIEEIEFVVQGKSNNTLIQTEKIIDDIEKEIKPLQEHVREYFSSVGYIVQGGSQLKYATNLGFIQLFLNPNLTISQEELFEKIEPIRKRIFEKHKDKLVSLDARKTVVGPAQQDPIYINIFHPNYNKTIAISQELEKYIKTLQNTIGVENSYETSKKEIVLDINENLASSYGISTRNLATQLRYAIDGGKASSTKSIIGNDDEIDIIVTYPKSSNFSIKNIPIQNKFGKNISLKEFAQIRIQNSYKSIKHKEGKKFISVSSQIKNTQDNEYNSEVLNNLIESHIQNEISKKNPNASFEFEGSRKENSELLSAVLIALILTVLGILIILVIFFRNYTQPIMVMVIIPFAFVGLVWGLFLNQVPIGLMPMLGMIALTGVIVNDSLILVKFINESLIENIGNPIEAIVDGAKSRLRPIILTSLTTLSGLFPLAYGIFGEEPFLAPMAIALLWGLFFSSILVLFVIPLTYHLRYSLISNLSKFRSR